jgi:hypothetical protein
MEGLIRTISKGLAGLVTSRSVVTAGTRLSGIIPPRLSVFWPTFHAHVHPPTGIVLGWHVRPGYSHVIVRNRTPTRSQRPLYHTAPGPRMYRT